MSSAIDHGEGLGVDVHLDGVDGEEAVVLHGGGSGERDRLGGGEGDDTGALAPVPLLEVIGGADGEEKLHLDCVGVGGHRHLDHTHFVMPTHLIDSTRT